MSGNVTAISNNNIIIHFYDNYLFKVNDKAMREIGSFPISLC